MPSVHPRPAAGNALSGAVYPLMPAAVDQKLTESLITLLEQGTTPWRREWDAAGGGHHVNLISGRRYRGSNPVLVRVRGGQVALTRAAQRKQGGV